MTKFSQKKICLVSMFAYEIFNPKADLKFGGSETQMYFLAKNLAQNSNFKVDFIVLDVGQKDVGQKDEEIYNSIRLIKAYKRGAEFFGAITGFFKLMSALKKSNPEIIICRAFGREVGVAALYAKVFHKKLVYCFANDNDGNGKFFSGLGGKIFKFGFANADFYVAQSERQAAEFKKLFPNKANKISIIKNSWPESDFSGAEKDSILWVGSSSDLKRPKIFLNLVKDFPQEKFIMIMAKSKTNQAVWEEIFAQSKDLPNLQFLEKVPLQEIGKYFFQAKILVSTSSSEGFPNVFLQAAAVKTPILSLSVDPDGFIEKNDCGIVAGGDYEKLKQGLAKLLSQNEICRRKGENNFKYFQANHNLEKNMRKWEELFLSL